MTYLLEYHPIEIWSFFFGLIIASALLVAQQVGHSFARKPKLIPINLEALKKGYELS